MNSDLTVAAHALVYLDHRKTMLSSGELADNICTNPARVRKIMSRLSKAGIVETHEGIEGGYELARDVGDVTLADVGDALSIRYVGVSWRSGDDEMDCLVASGMADVMDAVYEQLDATCRDRLSNMTVEDLSKKIFHGTTVREREMTDTRERDEQGSSGKETA